ncbi:MAG: glycosyltransferase family 4 protein [Winogradskyella sp.]
MTNQKKPNVLIFTGMHSEKYGAFERYNVELAKQLHAKGIQAVFVYNEEPKVLAFKNDLINSNAELVCFNPNNKIITTIKNLYSLIKLYKPQIVHTHFNPSVVRLVCYLSFFLRVPKRYNTFHCMATSYKRITKVWMYSLNLFTTQQFAISEAIRQEQIDNFNTSKSKITTLRLGLDKSLFTKKSINKEAIRATYNLPKEGLLIGNIAFHDAVKGIDVLLDAFKLLCVSNKKVYLCQVGGHDKLYTKYLKEKAKALAIEHKIIWMGLQNDVPTLLNAFDVYVQPSRNEGLGLSILEAYYAKLPVVATRVGGIPEIVDEKKGFLVDNEDPKAMAKKLKELVDSKVLRAQKGEEAYHFVNSNYNVSTQVRKLITYYK